MAKTALTQLQDQIEAVRREAFAAGYAAAMQSIREFAAKPAPGAEPVATRPQRRRGATRAQPGRPARQRPPRAVPPAAGVPRPAAHLGGMLTGGRHEACRLPRGVLPEGFRRLVRSGPDAGRLLLHLRQLREGGLQF